jgi:predicted nucleic acid-binding protein
MMLEQFRGMEKGNLIKLVLFEAGRKAGHTFSQPDLIIAATALHHGLTIVTRDARDYQRARASVFNPWVDSLPESAS